MTGASILTDSLRKGPSARRDSTGLRGPGKALELIAFGLLLACLCGRCFLGEVPFRTSAVAAAYRLASAGLTAADRQIHIERTELARVTFAVLLLAAVAIWLLGRAIAGKLKIRYGWLGALILAFAAWSLAAAFKASDARSALDAWVEHVALLGVFFLAAQLCADRRRFGILVVVLAAIGIATAVKAIWQVQVEIPDRIAEFESNRQRYLTQLGITPGTPEEKMFERRVYDRSPHGFGPALANVLASVLIVLLAAGAGMAAEKLAAAARLRKRWKAAAGKGEIHLPTLAGIITAMAAGLVAVVLILTRSRGGTIAAGVAAGAAGVIFLARNALARHRRKALTAVAVVLVAAAAAVMFYGRKYDRLPTKTMTFRWFYWTASAEVARDHPLLGVGPGNFATGYLKYRRLPGGEEAVKMPHNAIAHAAGQYGLPGAVAYLAILVGTFICISRPTAQNAQAGRPLGKKSFLAAILLLAGSALASRAVFTEAGSSLAMFGIDAVLSACVLGVCMLLVGWRASGDFAPLAAKPIRVLVSCGLAGFALHNMVTFSLWIPAAATAFWIAAGACLGQAEGPKHRDLSKLRWPAAITAVAAVAAATALLWRPVWRRTSLSERAAQAVSDGHMMAAADLAKRAADADLLDPIAAADVANILRLQAQLGSRAQAPERLADAIFWADAAAGLDFDNASRHRLTAQISHESIKLAKSEPTGFKADEHFMLKHMALAVELDPKNARLRIEYARMLADTGRAGQCLAQLDQAERIDRAHYPDSTFRLSEAERREIRAIRKQARSSGA
ncbi:MAG: O-antigen ligase family protein [Planctomycetota bacterium]|jgi:O-antigen ligase